MKDTGGSAFPVFVDQYDYGYEKTIPKCVEPGMTLRDYFAAKAIQGIVANPNVNHSHTFVELSERAWLMADAMLKERNKE